MISREEYEKLPESEKRKYRKVLKGENIKRYNIICSGDYIKYLKEVSKPKLLIKDYSKRMRVAYDKGEYKCLRTIYCAYLSEPHLDIKYVLGILNSALFHFYYVAYFYTSRPGMGSFRYRTQFTKKLPVKLPKTTEEEKLAKEITNKVEHTLNHHKELSKLENKTSEFSDSYISEELHPLLNVMESQELSKESYSPSRLRIEVEDIEGRKIYKVALTKKDYIAFKTESSAKFLFEVLKRKDRIIKNDLLRMNVPSDGDAEEIMKGYEGDLDKMGGLKREIVDLDKSIDEQVYELYGLDVEDRRMIEEFSA